MKHAIPVYEIGAHCRSV